MAASKSRPEALSFAMMCLSASLTCLGRAADKGKEALGGGTLRSRGGGPQGATLLPEGVPHMPLKSSTGSTKTAPASRGQGRSAISTILFAMQTLKQQTTPARRRRRGRAGQRLQEYQYEALLVLQRDCAPATEEHKGQQPARRSGGGSGRGSSSSRKKRTKGSSRGRRSSTKHEEQDATGRGRSSRSSQQEERRQKEER